MSILTTMVSADILGLTKPLMKDIRQCKAKIEKCKKSALKVIMGKTSKVVYINQKLVRDNALYGGYPRLGGPNNTDDIVKVDIWQLGMACKEVEVHVNKERTNLGTIITFHFDEKEKAYNNIAIDQKTGEETDKTTNILSFRDHSVTIFVDTIHKTFEAAKAAY